MREDSLKSDPAAQIRHAAARHVLVSKLNATVKATEAPVANEVAASSLNEYTRLHIELAEMV